MVYKLDNVTSLTAARWATAEGFDYISFNFDKSDLNYIPPMQVAEICKWVTGIKFIGSFLNVEPSIILDLYKLLNLDTIEIDLKTAEYLLINSSIPTILHLDNNSIEQGLEFEKFNKDIFAFSFQKGREILSECPIDKAFVSSKFKRDTLLNTPFGISFNSANETEPGLIDFEELENSKNYWQAN